MTIHVTTNALHRWCERIDGTATIEQARAAIERSERAVQVAADFGCRCVRLGCGAKLVLDGTTVVTVLARGGMGIAAAMPGRVLS